MNLLTGNAAGGKRLINVLPFRVPEKPLISVVTVVLNGGKTLERTIKSVLSQIYPCIEYIILDGRSTDDTLDIIKKYNEKIDFWLSEKDKGIYHAMNRAISYCTGEFILYLNSDDELHNPKAIEQAANEIENNQIDVLYGNILVEDEYTSEKHHLGREYFLPDLMKEKKPPHPAFFVRRSLLSEYQFNERYRIAADYDLMCRLYMGGLNIQYLNEYIAIFHSGGASSKIFKTNKENALIIKKNFGSRKALNFILRKSFGLVFHFFLVILSRIGLRKIIRKFKNIITVKKG